MPGFDALYKQTITLFNRVKDRNGDDSLWYPTVIEGVHLITSHSSSWNSRGEKETDNVRLHIRYTPSGSDALIQCKGAAGGIVTKKWREPKVWRRMTDKEGSLTFAFGDAEAFDFFVEGVYADFANPVSDDAYERKGFYNWMNAHFDGVYAITQVSKFNLIPHFEIMAR